MKLKTKNLVYAVICLIVALIGVGPELHRSHVRHQAERTAVTAKQNHKSTNKQNKTRGKGQVNGSHMRTPIDWHQSSETVPYPDLKKVKNFWIKVSLKKNRTYLYDGQKLIYTMYSSGGVYKKDPKTGKMKSMTPTGTFHAQAERGDSFFNQRLNEGANYYVSWLNHGTYLFHSVPTKPGGAYNVKEAKKLGKSTGSHGCIRLSIPDAKWMSANLPVGTKIVIVND